ncbi:MAG: hypothetical protein NO516_02730, partial [Candidatus Methanomethylicia archaeon]|nr:hypothetical protein [Candidatus Methanomethylicia archaeon]
MTEVELTQREADILISMEKCSICDEGYEWTPEKPLAIPLESCDRKEKFMLDLSRRVQIALKVTYQNRTRETIILVRLDLGGGPHRNPNGVEVPCPHMHIYREGYGDKWADHVPPDKFRDTNDIWMTLIDFMSFCNIIRPPHI